MGKKGKEKNKGRDKKLDKKTAQAEQRKEERVARHKDRMTKRKMRRAKDKVKEKEYEEELEKFRLQLAEYGLRILEVGGDGNCLFRAIGDQLEGNQGAHKKYRQDAIEYMLQNREDFEPFVEDDETFDDYIQEIEKDGEWGGNLELQALAMKYQFNAIVHQFNAPVFALANFDPNYVRTIHLSYHMGEHYNSVRLWDDEHDFEPPVPIPLDLQKDPNRLIVYNEEKKAKEQTKKHKGRFQSDNKLIMKHKRNSQNPNKDDNKLNDHQDSFQESIDTESMPESRRMHSSKFPKADSDLLNDKMDQLNISNEEEHKEVIEEEKKGSTSNCPSIQEITVNLKAGRIYTSAGEWIKPPNKNKKWHCLSKIKYKFWCMTQDKKRIDKLLSGADGNTEKMNAQIQDADAKSFLASLICI